MPVSPKPWPVLSPRVQELFRQGAREALQPTDAWLEELHTAALSGEGLRAIALDPVLADALRRANLANLLHWASANVQHPGRRVEPYVGQEALDAARDLVRRGSDHSALDAYRTGQGVAWRRWLDICFTLTDDPDELRELLSASSLSIFTFVDDTVAAVTERMAAERELLTRGTHAERRATVTLLLEGAPVSRSRAEEQLGYGLTGPHTAVVVWGRATTSLDELEAVAESVTRASGAARRLTVLPGAGALWLWLPRDARGLVEALGPVLAGHPDVRVAVGRPGDDLEGFRRSHLDAVATQQVLARLAAPQRAAAYADVHLVALLTQDPAACDAYLRDTLGDLLTADADTRDTVLVYVREQCGTSRAAERLYTHRNTVVRRLARADELLPRPLASNVVEVAAALEVLRWRGLPLPGSDPA